MPLLAGLDEAAAEAAGAAAVVRGRLRVSVDPWFARMVLAPGSSGSSPAILCCRWISRPATIARSDDRRGRGGTLRPARCTSLIVRKLLETPVLTVAAPAYLERHGEPRSPHDLVHHEALLFRDPQTGLPFPWEFHRGGEIVQVKVSSRLVLDDPSVAVSACVAGQGHFPKPRHRPRAVPGTGRPRADPAGVVGRTLSALRLPPLAPSAAGESPSVSGFYPGDRQGRSSSIPIYQAHPTLPRR